MHLGDLFDPVRGPENLVKFALIPLVLVIACHAVTTLLSGLSALDTLLLVLFLMLVSPLAYAVREARLGRPRREGARRGAERTPVLPPQEEDR